MHNDYVHLHIDIKAYGVLCTMIMCIWCNAQTKINIDASQTCNHMCKLSSANLHYHKHRYTACTHSIETDSVHIRYIHLYTDSLQAKMKAKRKGNTMDVGLTEGLTEGLSKSTMQSPDINKNIFIEAEARRITKAVSTKAERIQRSASYGIPCVVHFKGCVMHGSKLPQLVYMQSQCLSIQKVGGRLLLCVYARVYLTLMIGLRMALYNMFVYKHKHIVVQHRYT